jgi:hypothetical protein
MAAAFADNIWLIAVPLVSVIALVLWHFLEAAEPPERPVTGPRVSSPRPHRRRPAATRRAPAARCAPARRRL